MVRPSDLSRSAEEQLLFRHYGKDFDLRNLSCRSFSGDDNLMHFGTIPRNAFCVRRFTILENGSAFDFAVKFAVAVDVLTVSDVQWPTPTRIPRQILQSHLTFRSTETATAAAAVILRSHSTAVRP